MTDSKKDASGEKLIATNPNARGNYIITDVLEAGIALTGTEVKSLRQQSPNLRDSYVDFQSAGGAKIEAYLANAHIGPYSHGNIWNHDPLRRRKLLLHAKELDRLFGAQTREGMTVVPTRMYFKKGIAKVELGLGKGKKKHDKRETIKSRSADREMARAVKRERR